MQPSFSSSSAKFSLLLFVGILCLSTISYSQTKPGSAAVVTAFGIKDTAIKPSATYAQILANPTLVCDLPGYKVKQFAISFLPKGRDYYGSYIIDGALLSGRPLLLLTEFKDTKNPKTVVMLENIVITHDGVAEKGRPIIMDAKP
jgi:hypothetical protein